MRILFRLGMLAALCAAISCRTGSSAFDAPGNLFVRQMIGEGDFTAWKAAFYRQKANFKERGITAYSLHRDLRHSDTVIFTLKCANLRKAMDFISPPKFRSSLDQAWKSGSFEVWAGTDVVERKYENRPKMTGGIVIANNQVRSYDFWKACFDAEGKHHHADRGYKASHYSIHHLVGKPDCVQVVHEASDVRKAPAFMGSAAMKGVMEASGVTGIEIWYGTNLEEGIF